MGWKVILKTSGSDQKLSVLEIIRLNVIRTQNGKRHVGDRLCSLYESIRCYFGFDDGGCCCSKSVHMLWRHLFFFTIQFDVTEATYIIDLEFNGFPFFFMFDSLRCVISKTRKKDIVKRLAQCKCRFQIQCQILSLCWNSVTNP